MTRTAPMTEEMKQQIYDLRVSKGLSHKLIAEQIGSTQKAVAWHCLIHDVERFDGRKGFQVSIDIKTHFRNGKLVRAYTIEEDEKIKELSCQGVTYYTIGKTLGRATSSIQARLATLARREERAGA